jgi:hypothetical protein
LLVFHPVPANLAKELKQYLPLRNGKGREFYSNKRFGRPHKLGKGNSKD